MKNITADNQLSVSAQRDPPPHPPAPLLLLLLKKTQAAPTFAFCRGGGAPYLQPFTARLPSHTHAHTHNFYINNEDQEEGEEEEKGEEENNRKNRVGEKEKAEGGIMEVDKLFRLAEMWHCLALNARNTHACTHTRTHARTLTRAVFSPASPALICVGHHPSFH